MTVIHLRSARTDMGHSVKKSQGDGRTSLAQDFHWVFITMQNFQDNNRKEPFRKKESGDTKQQGCFPILISWGPN